jgi:hypothetical protein
MSGRPTEGVSEADRAALEAMLVELAEIEPICQFFAYWRLPWPLAGVSAIFFAIAKALVETTPANAERTTALRKLLEARDCAVRAHLMGRTDR